MEILSAKNKTLRHLNTKVSLTKNTLGATDKKNCIISLRINTLLYDTLHNYLLSAHNISDYTFSSISDILRNILEQLENKKEQSCNTMYDNSDSAYIELTLRVKKEQKDFWATLPNRSKRKILEKGIVSFSKQRFVE